LQTSQEIKREADTIVDSVTASDIGAFPDKSVAEALQRATLGHTAPSPVFDSSLELLIDSTPSFTL